MMATTHILLGMSLALPVLVVAPEFAPVALVAGMIGGLFPDLDLYRGHRKTLHYPIYFSLGAIPTIAIAVLVPTTWTVAAAVAVSAAALHSSMDVFGGGLELKPWNSTSNRGVYSHFHGRWLRPRRWVRYDGAPEDLALASIVSLPLLVGFDGFVQLVIIGLLGVSIVYAIVRKHLVILVSIFIRVLPASFRTVIPERYLDVDPPIETIS